MRTKAGFANQPLHRNCAGIWAGLAAYGWPVDSTDEQSLELLLKLNLHQAEGR